MKTLTVSFAIVAALGLYAGPPAQAQSMKPGNYEYTTVTEMMGMKIPISFKQCVTQKDVDSNQAYASQQGAQGCTPAQVQRNGPALSVKFTCSEPKMTVEGQGTVNPTQFSMRINITQHELNNTVVTSQVTAKRVGDC